MPEVVPCAINSLGAFHAMRPGYRLSNASKIFNLGVLGNRAIATAALLHALAVDTRGPAGSKAALTSLLAAVVVDVLEVECVDVAGENAVHKVVLAEVKGKYEALDEVGQEREKTYPRMVRQMLTRRSAPQPATAKTPMGGTGLG